MLRVADFPITPADAFEMASLPNPPTSSLQRANDLIGA
jgi:hypothetical protein